MKFCKLALLLFVYLLSINIVSGQGVAENKYWSQVAKIPIFQRKCNFNGSGKLVDIAINSNDVMLGFTPHIPPRHDVVHWCEDDINILVRSTDNGKSWRDITKSLPDVVALKTPEIRKVPLYRSFWYWHLNIDYILVDGNDFYIVTYAEPYTNDVLLGHNFIYKSSDDGLTWQYLTSTPYDATVIVNKGIIHAYNSEFDNTFSYKKQELMKWYPDEDRWIETDYLVGPYREYRQYKTDNGIRKEFKQGHDEEIDLSLVELASFDGGKTFHEEFRVNEDNEISYDKGMNWSKSIYEDLYRHSIVKQHLTNSLMPHLSANIKMCGNYIFNIVRKGENRYVVRTGYLGANIEYLWKYDSISMPYLSSHMDRDGYIYRVMNNILYKSNYQFNCEEDRTRPTKQKDLVYGTTIITHGFQLTGSAPIDENEWAYQMALEILKKATKGVIKVYDKQSGRFIKTKSVGVGGETILLFDWAYESQIDVPGFSEAAGDALFVAMLMEEKGSNTKLKNLHFISHSRGTVVTSECVRRLLTIGIDVDHVTYLDPHDWGLGPYGQNRNNDYDVCLECLEIPGFPNSHQAINNWDGIAFCDTYYQTNGIVTSNNCGECFINGGLEGRAIPGSFTQVWNEYGQSTICHSNIHSCGYTKSIISPHLELQFGGYKYARLVGEQRPQNQKMNGISIDKDFFFRNYEYNLPDGSKFTRIKGIVNGSFDRGEVLNIQGRFSAILPGWEFHGGNSDLSLDFIRFDNGQLELNLDPNLSQGVATLMHNRLYCPEEANSISFKFKLLHQSEGMLIVKINSETKIDSKEYYLKFEKPIKELEDYYFNIEGFKDDVITMEFKLFSSNNSETAVVIDDVCFTKKIVARNNLIVK